MFDADGGLIVPHEPFSRQYARKRGLDPNRFEAFFKGDFTQTVVGKADLKELIRKNHDIWQWDDDPQALLNIWFEGENQINEGLLEFIREQKALKLPVYMATNQEKYRARYVREVMFPDTFDGVFVSSDIGHIKEELEFWPPVLGKLAVDVPGIKPEEIIFFDDSPKSIRGAKTAGISTYLYKDTEQVKKVLSQ